MKVVYYPEDIEGATNISGWVDEKHTSYSLKIGDYIEMDGMIASAFVNTFPFLKVYETLKDWRKARGIEEPTKPKKKEKVEKSKVEPKGENVLDLEKVRWVELRKMAKEKGIFKRSMTREETVKALSK